MKSSTTLETLCKQARARNTSILSLITQDSIESDRAYRELSHLIATLQKMKDGAQKNATKLATHLKNSFDTKIQSTTQPFISSAIKNTGLLNKLRDASPTLALKYYAGLGAGLGALVGFFAGIALSLIMPTTILLVLCILLVTAVSSGIGASAATIVGACKANSRYKNNVSELTSLLSGIAKAEDSQDRHEL